MTSKTTIVLFGLLAALIIPLTMGISAEPVKTNKQLFDEVGVQHAALTQQMRDLDDKNKPRSFTAEEITQKKAQIQVKLNALELEADKIQKRNVEAHKMPADIENFLETAYGKVQNEIENSDGAFINGKTRTLVVLVDSEEDIQKVRDLVGYVDGKNTHLEIRVESLNFSGCTAQDAECNPTMGRIQIDGNGSGDLAGRLAVPYTRGTTEGFLTAGHMVDNSVFVYQPLASTNKIGIVSSSDVQVSGNCDCAWVAKTGSKTFSERIFDTGFSWGYSWYAIDAHNTPSAGTFVSVGKKSGIVHSVEITDYKAATVGGVNFSDMMWLDTSNSGGDSGGPIFGNISHDFHGIISGGGSTVTIASHWNNINNAVL